MRILVSDDDPILRKFVSIKLRDLGEIHEACDGSETLAKLKQHKIDLLLLDWVMPVLSGLDVPKTIRGRGMQLPVIMVTAESCKQRVVTALEAGATDYLIKPFEASTLLAKIQKFFRPQAQGGEARRSLTSWTVAER